MKQKLLLLFLMLYAGFMQAQLSDFNFRNINISDGLSNNMISSISEDKFGQIWFGTSNGLNKYNGQEFTVYRNVPRDKYSISSSDVTNVIVDRDGYVWAGTFNGLNRYNPRDNTFKRFYRRPSVKYSLSNNLIICSLEMKGGDVWFGTANGISIYQKKRKRFVRFLQGNIKKGPRIVNDIFGDAKNNTWVATSLGLVKVTRGKSGKYIVKEFNVGKKATIINSILKVNSDVIAVGTKYNGLLYFNIKKEKFTRSESIHIPENLDVRDLEIDSDKRLWVATTSGLFIITKENKTISIKENTIGNFGTIQNFIRTIYKDKNGFMWLGTQNGGVITWDKSYQNFLHFRNQNLPNNITNGIVADTCENIYFATEGGVVNVMDKRGDIIDVFNIDNSNKNVINPIKSLYFCDPNLLFVGTKNKGIFVYDVTTKTVQENIISKELKCLLENSIISDIKKDSKNQLYIATNGKGLFRYDLKTKKIRIFARPGISSNFIKNIFIDEKDNVVIGCIGGASLIEFNEELKSEIKNYFKDKPHVTYNISAVFKDSNGVFWFGTTTRGLYRLDKGKIKRVKILHRNNFSTVNSILEGEKGVLWLSTDRGVVKYNSATNKSFAYSNNIIADNNFRENSSLKIGNQFYFGDLFGVTTFNPKKIIKVSDVPRVALSQLKIKNKLVDIDSGDGVLSKSLNYTDAIDLEYNNSNFSISYALPNYINPKGNRYAYRLKGLDDSWTYTKQTEAFFTLQTAGSYVFQVKAANHDNVWNNKPTNMKVIIKPAPWKTWWAYTMYAILLFGLFYVVSWFVQSKSRLKAKLELEYIASKKNEELNKAKLEFFTNISHEFRTPLTLIIGPLQNVLQNYTGTSDTYRKLRIIESSTNHLLRLINRLMDFRKLETNHFQLAAAEGNVVKFLKEIFLSFSEHAKNGGYTYQFHATEDDIKIYYDRYKLERVFYNLISNAFRYTEEGGTILVNVSKETDNIVINITDSGVGVLDEYVDKIFDRFFEVAAHKKGEKEYSKGTGIGLSIAKNIVKLHHGDISVKNVVPKGAMFTVKLKLGKEHLSKDEIVKNFKMSDDVSQYVSQIEMQKETVQENIEDLIADEKKYTILVVEDNIVLRSFIKEMLKTDYNVLEAGNGKIALEKAIKNVPDLIVSDVIMPKMVGTELCSKIKTTLATSHIPVILLTSRTSLVYKFEGLESGADDYISKPFNLKEFRLKIHNLLVSKQRLKEKFASDQNFETLDVSLTSLDQKLLEKAFKIVKENISNEDFNITQFSEDLGVSRSMLFTKIKAWANATPNEFIQEIRLNRAKKILELDKFTVAEVSFKVGFKRTKYFSQCFKKKYNLTPSEYAKKFSGKQEN